MQTQYLEHKHGGRIVAFHSMGHSTYKGVASWFYVCDVDWNDGTKSDKIEVAPWALCFDHSNAEARREYEAIVELLSNYLEQNGEWHQRPKKGDLYT